MYEFETGSMFLSLLNFRYEGFPVDFVLGASAKAAFPLTPRAPEITAVFFIKSRRSYVVFRLACIEQIKIGISYVSIHLQDLIWHFYGIIARGLEKQL